MKKITLIGELPSDNSNSRSGPSTVLRLVHKYFFDAEDVKVYLINIFQKNDIANRGVGGFSIKRSFFILKQGFKFLKISKKEGGLVYLFISPSNVGFLRDFMFILLASMQRKKIILHQLGNYIAFYKSKNSMVKTLIRILFRNSKHIIVEGDIVKNFFLDQGFTNNFKIIPNSAPDLPEGLSRKENISRERKVLRVIYLSNMIYSKGYNVLLKSIPILKKELDIDVIVTFVGKFIDIKSEQSSKIQQKKEFFDYITKNNLSKNVIYIEGLWGEDKYKAYLKNDIFVLPTSYIYEMQPISIIEAMSCGLPVISTSIGLIPTLIEDGKNGLIMQQNTSEELASALIKLTTNTKLYSKISSLNNEKFRTLHSEDVFLERISQLLYG